MTTETPEEVRTNLLKYLKLFLIQKDNYSYEEEKYGWEFLKTLQIVNPEFEVIKKHQKEREY